MGIMMEQFMAQNLDKIHIFWKSHFKVLLVRVSAVSHQLGQREVRGVIGVSRVPLQRDRTVGKTIVHDQIVSGDILIWKDWALKLNAELIHVVKQIVF